MLLIFTIVAGYNRSIDSSRFDPKRSVLAGSTHIGAE